MDLKKIAIESEARLKANPYPGRGIVLGATPDGKNAVQIYWIMGRSSNSRNRVFEEKDGVVRTKAFDESRVTDPSLIIYNVARALKGVHIVTNGDQTDTIYDFLAKGQSMEEALMTREFEPDAPNFTPRISGITDLSSSQPTCALSILRSLDGDVSQCQRMTVRFSALAKGFGHCIHTYEGDGNPLPSFRGDPRLVLLDNDPGALADRYWNMLNRENRVSLLVKFIDMSGKGSRVKIINANGK